ncbi:MAG: DUF5916 domain-containing protein [Ferruginibacter sp.]
MKFLLRQVFCLVMCGIVLSAGAQSKIPQKKISIVKTNVVFKIDGELNEPEWKKGALADSFVCLRPVAFKPEGENPSKVYFLYSDEGIYIGGYFYEKNKDSITTELKGRDGFGNNDFAGVIFDTYNDRLNGFEYFVTPQGEQWDAKASTSNDNSEDFSWNAVWQSNAKVHNNGWSFEMFIPYAAIRFGKKNIQDWGLNIVRKRRKSDEQLFWQPIDPNVNGFLTQSGIISGFENIKPPMRLQFSPYFSTYFNHEDAANGRPATNKLTANGGMDVKYGINQAFTLDMTLIPDFGQVQTDNRVLNLSPFEVRFSENRTFFTEGTELFNKGSLFYSRRIGRVGDKPLGYYDAQSSYDPNTEKLSKNPDQVKLINATKISGRTQKGLGIGFLNAITNNQYATIENTLTGEKRRIETEPFTNYNVFVLDQTMKNNSSVSLVNTNMLRNGSGKDANVSAFLFDLNDKKNTWNVGGNVSVSMINDEGPGKSRNGYAHGVYFGKTSGRLNFRAYQDLYDDKYDKSDMGYFTNNNYLEHGLWVGYNWLKPKENQWYRQIRLNYNVWHNQLVTPLDALKRKDMMFQNAGTNINGNAQMKKLWWAGFSISVNSKYNDFYEPRMYGRVFRNKGNIGGGVWVENNGGKKFYWSISTFARTGGLFNFFYREGSLTLRQQFSSKFTIDNTVNISANTNGVGWADTKGDTIIFARRNVATIEEIMNIKYSFSNKKGLTLRLRHYWSKVDPSQFYELDPYGDLKTPSTAYNENRNQNYNFLSADLVYNWQFAQGSFISVVWKDIGESFNREFEKTYFSNLGKTIQGNQFNSFSVRMIYFMDYLTMKKKLKRNHNILS